eukprot:gene18133-23787_t
MNKTNRDDSSGGSESDLSDVYEEDDFGNEQDINFNWLEEIDEETIQDTVQVPGIDIPDNEYIMENTYFFLGLCEVEDLNFVQLPVMRQEELMRSLIIERYAPSQVVFEEGSSSSDMYFIIGCEDPLQSPEVEVVKMEDDKEKVLTRLSKGQYFGQKFFLTKRWRQRSATIRIPNDSPSAVDVAKLIPENFDKWENYRNILIIKAVPLIQMLPKQDLNEIIEKMQIKEYNKDEYIIRQGESGDEFFIIREGAVKIVDETNINNAKVLTTLKEGHFFGEMALVTNEKRVASVISIDSTICLSLTKASFKSALSASTFSTVVEQVLEDRRRVREQRNQRQSIFVSSSNVTVDNTISANHSTLSVATNQVQASTLPRMSLLPIDSISLSATPTKSIMASSSSSIKQRTRASSSRYSLSEVNFSNLDDIGVNTPTTDVTVTFTVKVKKLRSGSRLINKYLILKELGKGSFGEVFLCQDEETNVKYAMKVINRSANNDDITAAIRREIAVMKRLQHENVVSLHEVIDDPSAKKIFLIQEYMEGGSLLSDEENVNPIPVDKCRSYFRDMLCGICYLHAEGIIHRDIKPSNMLLTGILPDGRQIVKIADFGAAVFTSAYEKAEAGGTPAYMAPELCIPNTAIEDSKLPAIDVFALGATLYCMLHGRPPWMANNAIDLATKIKNIELSFPNDSLDPHLKFLLKRMLDKDYKTRITLDEVISDDWVTLEGSDPLFHDDLSNDDDDHDQSTLFSDIEIFPPLNLSDSNAKVIFSQVSGESLVIDTLAAESKVNKSTPITTPLDLRSQAFTFDVSLTLDKRAIVKDDRPVIRNALIRHLKSIGIKGHGVDGGAIVISEITNKSYDIIVYDFFSSDDENEIATIKSFRSLGFGGCIIIMSDTDDSLSKLHSLKSHGVNYVLRKPIQYEQLNKILTHYYQPSKDLLLASDKHNINDDMLEKLYVELSDDSDSDKDAILQNYDAITSVSKQKIRSNNVSFHSDVIEESTNKSDTSSLYSTPSEPNKSYEKMNVTSKNERTESIATDDINMASLRSYTPEQSYQNLFEDYPQEPSSKAVETDNSKRDRKVTIKEESPESNSSDGNDIQRASRRLTRTIDFMLVPSDIVFDESGQRAKKSIAIIGSQFSMGSYFGIDVADAERRKKLRDDAMKKSKRQHKQVTPVSSASSYSYVESPQSEHILTNFTPSSRITPIRGNFFGGPSINSINSANSNIWNNPITSESSMSGKLLSKPIRSSKALLQSSQLSMFSEKSSKSDASIDVELLESPLAIVENSFKKPVNLPALMIEGSSQLLPMIKSPSQDSDSYDDDKSSDDSSFNEELIYIDDVGLDSLVTQPATVRTDSPTPPHQDGDAWSFEPPDFRNISVSPDQRNDTLNVRFGEFSLIGARTYMEDRNFCHPDIISLVKSPSPSNKIDKNLHFFLANKLNELDITTMSFLSVYDGHNGEYVAETLKQYLHLSFLSHIVNPVSENESSKDTILTYSLRQACREVDMKVLKQDYARQLDSQLTGGSIVTQRFAGSVGVALVIYSQVNNIKVTIANVGDCRAVLSDADGIAKQLTTDHKPTLPQERARIEASGGFVHNNRVNGLLAVSRSFGDLQYKLTEVGNDNFSQLLTPRGEDESTQQVISEPEIIEFNIETNYDFIILASDGLWEVMSNQEAVDYTRRQLRGYRNVELAAKALVNKAKNLGSLDNITAVVCMLNQRK